MKLKNDVLINELGANVQSCYGNWNTEVKIMDPEFLQIKVNEFPRWLEFISKIIYLSIIFHSFNRIDVMAF